MDWTRPPRQFQRKYDRRQDGLLVPSKTAGLWTPNSISGIYEYWDFSDTSKITQSAGLVSAVAGQKGVASLSQGGVLRPVTGTRTINGLNVLDFDGVDDNITNLGLAGFAQPVTYWLVYQNDTIANDQRVIDTTGRCLYDASLAASGAKRAMFAGSTIAGATAASTSAEQVVVTLNGASSQIWLAGVSEVTGNAGGNGFNNVIVGSDNAGSACFDGRIAFVGVSAGVPSAGERTSWNTWCARWGL